jgi:sarcosine oxidase, subunit beta
MIYKEADVIVIGGGIAGSSIALRLAEKGQKVILLDKGRVGEEASGRAAGCVRKHGRPPAELHLGIEAIKIWERMEEELGYDVGYRQCGNVRMTLTQEEHEAQLKIHEREKNADIFGEMLSPEETRNLIPTIAPEVNFIGAKYDPEVGFADPLKVVKAICRAAVRKGVVIKEHEAVTQLTLESGRITSAFTEEGEYRAGTFVIAAGAWSRRLSNLIDLDFPLTVTIDRLIITEPVPEIVKPFICIGDMYFRQTRRGNFHLSGGYRHNTPLDDDNPINFEGFSHAANGVVALFPQLKTVNVIRGYTGTVAYMPDGLPILDKAPHVENLFLTAGFHGHGFTMGPIVGKMISEWIVDGKPSLDLTAFKWTRFDKIKLSSTRSLLDI